MNTDIYLFASTVVNSLINFLEKLKAKYNLNLKVIRIYK